MNHINYLESVIRPVTEHTIAASSAETIVIIDASRKQSIDRVGLIDTYMRDLRYFLVSNTEDVQKIAKAAIRLPYTNGLLKDQKISLILRYEARCNRGNERRVAENLFNGSNPGVVFNDLLAKWVNEYLNARLNELLEDYRHEKTILEAHIKHRAFNEVGLDLDVEVSIEGQDKLETVAFGPTVFRVGFNDCLEEEDLEVKAAIGVDEQRLVKALLNQSVSVTDLVTKTVREYFANKISLNTFYFELSDGVEPEVISHLNEALRSVGRKVVSISLDAQTDVPRSFKKNLEITYNNLRYPEPIIIKFSVLMGPHDIFKYRAKKSPALDSWIEGALRDVIDEVLFEIEYLELLLNFEPIEKKIKEELNRKTETIGITLRQLIAKPDSEPADRLRRIDIQINKDTDEGLFETSISDCSIRLGVALTARISDLKSVSGRLKDNQNIPEDAKRKIHTLMKRYLRAIDPERFYSRYSHTDPQRYPHEVPVERELNDMIVTLLDTEFHAEVSHLTLTSSKTEITDQLAKLLRETHDFRATLSLGGGKGSGVFGVTGSFSVEIVHHDGWKRFKERDSSIEKIKKRIEDSIQAELKPLSTSLLLLRDKEDLDKLKGTLLSAAKKLILDEFGLVINLTTVVCSFTGIEEYGRRTTRIMEKITRLEELRIDMLASGGSSKDEIEGVEAQIEMLKSLLLS